MEMIMCKQAKNRRVEPAVAAQYRMEGNTCMSCVSTDICLEAKEINDEYTEIKEQGGEHGK